MVQNRVKNICSGKIEEEFKYESYNEIIENTIELSFPLAQVFTFIFILQLINNDNADVRKTIVFCFVDIHTVIGDELF